MSEREAFEKWAVSEEYDLTRAARRPDEYHFVTQDAWVGWQARAALATDALDRRTLKAAAKVCRAEKVGANADDHPTDRAYDAACDDCSKAVLALAQPAPEQPEAGADDREAFARYVDAVAHSAATYGFDSTLARNAREAIMQRYGADPHNAGEQGEAVAKVLEVNGKIAKCECFAPIERGDVLCLEASAPPCRGEQQDVPPGMRLVPVEPDFLEFESYDDKLRRCGLPVPDPTPQADKQATLERAVIDAALNLCDHMGCFGFCVPVPNTTPTLYVYFGETNPLALNGDDDE